MMDWGIRSKFEKVKYYHALPVCEKFSLPFHFYLFQMSKLRNDSSFFAFDT